MTTNTSIISHNDSIKLISFIVPVYVHAVRALEITGIALVAVALGCGVLKLLVWKDKKILAKFATGFSCAAGMAEVFSREYFSVMYSSRQAS